MTPDWRKSAEVRWVTWVSSIATDSVISQVKRDGAMRCNASAASMRATKSAGQLEPPRDVVSA